MKSFLKIFLLCTVASVLLVASAHCGDEQIITLKDGTVIHGKLIGIQGDEHVFQSSSLGEIRVKYDEIANISYTAAPDNSASVTLSPFGAQNPAVQQAQDILLSDPEITDAMMDLASDPEMAKLLQKPSLLRKMQSMSPEEIQQDPDLKKLLDNPTMKKILQKAAEKLQGAQP